MPKRWVLRPRPFWEFVTAGRWTALVKRLCLVHHLALKSSGQITIIPVLIPQHVGAFWGGIPLQSSTSLQVAQKNSLKNRHRNFEDVLIEKQHQNIHRPIEGSCGSYTP